MDELLPGSDRHSKDLGPAGGHSMVRRSSLAGSPAPSSRASTRARTASNISRPARSTCSTRSGRASPSAVTARQIGQNPTEHTGAAAGFSPSGAFTGGAFAPRVLDAAFEPPPVRVERRGRAVGPALACAISFASSLTHARAGACRAGEPYLQAILHEPRSLHVQSLQGLGEDEVSLVGTHPDVQLVGLSEHIEVVPVHERQAHRKHVGGSPLPN